MKFKIDPVIFEKYPELNIGIVIVKKIDNKGPGPEILEQKEKEIREKYSLDTLKEEPKIAAWREAYRSFGAKPKKYKCSVENLYRMVLKGIDLRHINKLVDIYNYVSLKYMVPVGGDDIDNVDGDIELTFAEGNEDFLPLNANEIMHPKNGEVVYRDDKDILCRRWNWRECDKSKMTENTRNATVVVEGLPPMSVNEVEEVIGELKKLIQQFCGGEIQTVILNKGNPEVEI